METIALVDFFEKIGYDWTKDKDKIEKICYLTKTRVDNNITKFSLLYGMEQPFVIKAISEFFKSDNFFEMGTGRGTASYSVALNSNIKEIVTIDIVGFSQKQSTSVGHRAATVSNKELYEKIGGEEKKKIKFLERKHFSKTISNFSNKFDLCFIDGEHDKESVISEDIRLAQKVSKEGAVFIFDDYCLNKFSVKKIVDNLLNDKKYNSLLIEMRGHLFDNGRKEKDEGLVVISDRKLF
ncbi:MAG: class I SAM-dependent methyltransferase [Patescibacteria group bacterium]